MVIYEVYQSDYAGRYQYSKYFRTKKDALHYIKAQDDTDEISLNKMTFNARAFTKKELALAILNGQAFCQEYEFDLLGGDLK